MSQKPKRSKDLKYTVKFKTNQETLHDLAFAKATAEGASSFGPWIAQLVCDLFSDKGPAVVDSTTPNDLVADLREDIRQLANLILEEGDGPDQAAHAISQLASAVDRLEHTQAEILEQLRQFEAAVKHSVSTILTQPELNKATAREYVNKVFR